MNPQPIKDEVAEILTKFGRRKYELGAGVDGGFPKLSQSEAQAAIERLIVAARIDELRRIKDTAFPDQLANVGAIYALQIINDRLAKLKEK